MDVPAGITQEEGHTEFLIHLPSAVLLARRIQPFISLVDREVEYLLCTTHELIVLHLLSIFFFLFFLVMKNPSSCNSHPNVRRF